MKIYQKDRGLQHSTTLLSDDMLGLKAEKMAEQNRAIREMI
jgi:hypothetical protein